MRVGKSTPNQDWRERQDAGSVYRIRFTLPVQAPQLEIDGYFLASAPAALELKVNGMQGRVRIEPQTGVELDERQANRPNYAAAEVRAPLDAAFFTAGANTIEIRLTGDGAWQYDCVRLRRAALEGTFCGQTTGLSRRHRRVLGGWRGLQRG